LSWVRMDIDKEYRFDADEAGASPAELIGH
jgi:predicted dithiol-disulfide oxidoreductase (DUF899 family)